ncbi:MAG: SH3 domain-containing protein, partial [Alphaproteobacteria bacterium]|nr:SH3 domain-containing protein [Alphaproteobacteria bacterium]
RKFFALKGADFEARLFLWYAGHGHSIGREGFLVPADAPPASDPLFKLVALHMRDFGGLMRLADANHVLSVFDACFSGTIFSARSGAAPAAITAKTAKPVRQFITSGTAGQQVRDDGSFRTLFLRALAGDEDADVTDDGYVTGDELGLYLSQQVATLTDAAQTPQYGKLHDVRFNEGDFVFAMARQGRKPAAAAPKAESDSDASMTAWQAIKESVDPDDFRVFIEAYPASPMAPFAKARLKKLETGRFAAVPKRAARPAPMPPKPRVPLEPMEAAYVTVKNANVRARPAVSAARVATLPAGTEIHVSGRTADGKWLRVERDGKALGYIYAPLLRDRETWAQSRRRNEETQEGAESDARRMAREARRRRPTTPTSAPLAPSVPTRPSKSDEYVQCLRPGDRTPVWHKYSNCLKEGGRVVSAGSTSTTSSAGRRRPSDEEHIRCLMPGEGRPVWQKRKNCLAFGGRVLP